MTGGSGEGSLRHLAELLAHVLDEFGRLACPVREKADEDVLLVALHVHARRRCARLDDAGGECTSFLLEDSVPLAVELLRKEVDVLGGRYLYALQDPQVEPTPDHGGIATPHRDLCACGHAIAFLEARGEVDLDVSLLQEVFAGRS